MNVKTELCSRWRHSSTLLLGLVTCLLLLPATLSAQSRVTVKGTVTDETDQPVMSASVKVIGMPNKGAITDLDGHFTLTDVASDATLRISYVGYIPQEIKLNGRTSLTIKLLPDSELLGEVVVVGYGTQKKENLTGAVASVDVEKTLQNRPIGDVGHALQGVTPGLSVTSISGQLGQGPAIKLRGASGSLNATKGTTPLILVDNVPVPDLSFVNPNDIANISVLKDAASSSIYGTRAAFGVILITTKKGRASEKPRITYSTNFAWNTPTVMPKLAKSYENAQALLLMAEREGGSSVTSVGYNIDDLAVQKMKEWYDKYHGMSEEELGEIQEGRDFEFRGGKYYWYRDFDPIDMFMRKWAPQQNHNLTISGGTDKTTYSMGLGFLKQTGSLKFNPDNNQRYTFTPSISTQINKWLRVHGSVMYTHDSYARPYRFTSGVYDMWYYLLRWPSFYPYGTYEGKPFRNAITEVQQAKMETRSRNYSRINAGAVFTPIENLDINFDYTYTHVNTYTYRPGGQVWGRDFFNTDNPLKYDSLYSKTHNRVIEYSDYADNHVYKLYGTYNLMINDNHRLKFMAGFDAEENEYRGHSSQRRELVSLDYPEIALAIGDQYVDDNPYHYDRATCGFFGRINYDLLGRYLFEVNARYDASSKFPEGSKWGFFPSGSIGWRVSEESFFEPLKPAFSDLKLRASFGSIGNQDVAANAFLSTISQGTTAWLIDGKELPYFGTPNAISPILTWERVSTYDVGADMRFWDNKLGLTIDWYRRITSDMHSPGETLPATFGQTVPKVNEGELTSTGLEMMLDFRHEFENGLGLTAGASFSTVKEVVTKYTNKTKNINGIYEGKVLGEIWGYETDRFFTIDDCKKNKDGIYVIDTDKVPTQKQFETGSFVFGPGDIKYKDLNGDGKIDYGSNTVDDHGDLKVIGNSRPLFEYSFNLGLTYKGLDFSTFFQGVGRKNVVPLGSVGTPGFTYEAMFEHQMDYWTPENPNAYYPRLAHNGNLVGNSKNFKTQTKYLLNLAYLRLKNLTVGYTIPESLSSAVGLQSLRVYLSGENLFEFYDKKIPVDPETSTYKTGNWADAYSFGRTFPFSRTISVGAQVRF